MTDANDPDRPADAPLTPYQQAEARDAIVSRVGIGLWIYLALSAGWLVYVFFARPEAHTIWGGWVCLTAGLLAGAAYLRFRHRRAGYGYGVLLGLGICGICGLVVVGMLLLLQGLCYRSHGAKERTPVHPHATRINHAEVLA